MLLQRPALIQGLDGRHGGPDPSQAESSQRSSEKQKEFLHGVEGLH
jgi:hypothetical protein